MEIFSDRIALREFNNSDFTFYKELEQNVLTYKYENNSPDEKEIIDSFHSVLVDFESNPRERYKLAVCLKSDMKPIGRVSIMLNWEEIREWEIGWALHPDYWKKGYATEAVKLLIGYAFSQLNAHRIVAFANAENYLSEKVMIRSGMLKDGVLRETRYCNNRWCNELIYAVLEKDWDVDTSYNVRLL